LASFIKAASRPGHGLGFFSFSLALQSLRVARQLFQAIATRLALFSSLLVSYLVILFPSSPASFYFDFDF
jgi:hypothetical protein